MRVYIGQYDCFWSLTLNQWVSLCKEASKGEGYDLTPFKRLKSRPNGVLKNIDADSYYANSYYTIDESILYFEPLDWYAEEFSDWLINHNIPFD